MNNFVKILFFFILVSISACSYKKRYVVDSKGLYIKCEKELWKCNKYKDSWKAINRGTYKKPKWQYSNSQSILKPTNSDKV